MLDQLLQHVIVIDVTSSYVFLGTLTTYDDRYLVLNDADVHDLRDTVTTRERYVLESKQHGIHKNREQVFVCRQDIVSISRLVDVVE